MEAHDIENRFTYHKPFGTQREQYEFLRSAAKEFAAKIVHMTPSSREQSLAITHLEEAIFWANVAIARNKRET